MYNWAIYICVSIICGTIFYMLVPNGNMEKSMKLVLNVFLVSSLITPLIKNLNYCDIFNCLDKIYNSDEVKMRYSETVKKTDEEKLKSALKIVLAKSGYKFLDINIDISKDNSKVKNVGLKIAKDKNYDINQIKQIVKNETGLDPEIIYCQ